MKTIWKYELLGRYPIISIPEKSQILSLQDQNNVLCLWAYVDTDRQDVERWFRIFSTGEELPIDKSLKYIGTVQSYDKSFVQHVFERMFEYESSENNYPCGQGISDNDRWKE